MVTSEIEVKKKKKKKQGTSSRSFEVNLMELRESVYI